MPGYLPLLDDVTRDRKTIAAFGGYNHSPQIADNEFDGMKNMSSSYYPRISTRSKRGIFTEIANPYGLAAKSNLFWVDGSTLYHNGVAVEGLTLAENAKQMVSMGGYLLIWPDKKYYNTADQTYGNLEASITIDTQVICTLTKADGAAYDTPTVSDTEPAAPEDGDLWLDTSVSPHALKQFSDVTDTWVPVVTTYVKISATNIGSLFNQGDGVTISGISEASLNGDIILQAVDDDYIVVIGVIDEAVTQDGGVTVTRSVPAMDFVTENNNRVFGCSSANHEIYACKLGDPFNWKVYAGLSTDAWAATIGSDGDFTGACTYNGNVYFFKEDLMHPVYGNIPANFQYDTVPCRGVEKGSERSLVICNERLFYKSRSGVCMFDGSAPIEASAALGDVRYRYAVAGAVGNKVYMSMKGPDDNYNLFVLDTRQGRWHREDDTHALYFATHEGELFYVDADTNMLMTVGGRLSVHADGVTYDAVNGAAEEDFAWFIETGDIGIVMPDNKFISNIEIKMFVETAQEIHVGFQYDGASTWDERVALAFTAMRTVKLPIIPRRCEYMRMKISGTGAAQIIAITKIMEMGDN